MIELSNLDFSYPGNEFRLRIEEFLVEAKGQIALVGPSGSGKSTLLHLMAGIHQPRSGKVMIDGQNLAKLSRSAISAFRIAKIGLVFQSFELLEYLSVLDNLLLPFRLNRSLQLTQEVRERADALASDLGVEGKLRRRPSELSQGERQRVAIGRALITEPTLLLADEPTGNLDPTNKERVLKLMLQSAAKRGITVAMVTHDHGLLHQFEEVYEVCSRGRESASAEITKFAPESIAAFEKGESL